MKKLFLLTALFALFVFGYAPKSYAQFPGPYCGVVDQVYDPGSIILVPTYSYKILFTSPVTNGIIHYIPESSSVFLSSLCPHTIATVNEVYTINDMVWHYEGISNGVAKWRTGWITVSNQCHVDQGMNTTTGIARYNRYYPTNGYNLTTLILPFYYYLPHPGLDQPWLGHFGWGVWWTP